jgi:hypothetical protein
MQTGMHGRTAFGAAVTDEHAIHPIHGILLFVMMP